MFLGRRLPAGGRFAFWVMGILLRAMSRYGLRTAPSSIAASR
jgi:hypothetical protein